MLIHKVSKLSIDLSVSSQDMVSKSLGYTFKLFIINTEIKELAASSF